MCENDSSTEIGKKVTEDFVKNASQAYVGMGVKCTVTPLLKGQVRISAGHFIDNTPPLVSRIFLPPLFVTNFFPFRISNRNKQMFLKNCLYFERISKTKNASSGGDAFSCHSLGE